MNQTSGLTTDVDKSIDKSQWGAGVWHDEPDYMRWIDRDTGLACIIRRNPFLGNLCGYVALKKDEYIGLHYNSEELLHVEVHGGLTFSDRIDSEGNDWFVGFDCAHFMDWCPGLSRFDLGK